jgi:diaminopimelate dehydrogenase
VHFISAESFARDHGAMPHGGFVIRSAQTRPGVHQVIEYHLQLDSNPEFTASVLVACARAAARMNAAGQIGAQTVFDIAPALLSPRSPETLRAALL